MTIKRIDPGRLQRIVERYKRELERANGRATVEAERVAVRMDAAIVRYISEGNYQVDEEALAKLMSSMRRTIANGSKRIQGVMEEHVPNVAGICFEKSAATVSILEGVEFWNRVSDTRVLAAFEHFESMIANKSIIRASGPYLKRWQAEWSDEWMKAARKVQSSFTRAMVTGQTNQEIAKGLVNDLGRLDIAGKINPEDFAKAFVRTAAGELYQDLGLQVAAEAGLNQFVNIGVSDERESEECYNASQWGPHTLAEWEASPWGPPKRHVFNCRCDLVGITADAAKGDWKQPNPKFEKEAVNA